MSKALAQLQLSHLTQMRDMALKTVNDLKQDPSTDKNYLDRVIRSYAELDYKVFMAQMHFDSFR